MLICWDQWYPEGARLTAHAGRRDPLLPHRHRLASDGEEASTARRSTSRGKLIQRSHAVANGCYVCVANRIGHEIITDTDGKPVNKDGIEFWGQSFVASPDGAGRQARAGRTRKRCWSSTATSRRSSSAARTGRSCAIGASTPTATSPSGSSTDVAMAPRTRDAAAGTHRHAGRARLFLPARVGTARGTWIQLAAAGGHFVPRQLSPTRSKTSRGVIARSRTLEQVHINVPNDNYERIVRERSARRRRAAATRVSSITSRPTRAGPRPRAGVRAAQAARQDRGRDRRLGLQRVGRQVSAVGCRRRRADARSPRRLKLPVFYPRHRHGRRRRRFQRRRHGADDDVVPAEQEPQPGLSKAADRALPARLLRPAHVVWLGEGIEGDDTDGHIDDLARFIDARTIVDRHRGRSGAIANYAVLHENRRAARQARDQDGRPFEIVELPMPRPSSTTASGCRRPT